MISIQVEKGNLDIYLDSEVDLSWTGFRFSTGIRDAFTNDITIPKTPNNIALLTASGLLNSYNQPLGVKTKALLYNGAQITPVFLQVVSVKKNEIDICLYENTFPSIFKDKEIHEYFEDDASTIYEWNTNTNNAYPTVFKEYEYGMPYDKLYAQYHPVKNMNDILSDLSTATNFSFPSVSPNWYLMATKKVVCPQNQRQFIECALNPSTGYLAMSGGQHITNDMEISYGDGMEKITFNRDATVTMNMTISWKCKASPDIGAVIVRHVYSPNGGLASCSLNGDLYRNRIDTLSHTFYVNKGSEISIEVMNSDAFEYCYAVCDCTITDYVIEENENLPELQYIARAPRLIYYDYNSDRLHYAYFDGSTYYVSYKVRGVGGSSNDVIHSTFRSLSYFGYWCNVPEMKIPDMMFSLQWITGNKAIFDNNNGITWGSASTSKQIEGVIEEILPSSDKVAQNNFIKYAEDSTGTPTFTINNKWLATNITLHENLFGYIENVDQFKGKINQYSNPEHESGSEEYSCDFEDLGAPYLWWNNLDPQGGLITYNNNIRDIPINTFDLEDLTQAVEARIETETMGVKDVDIIYLDGRKFFIVEGSTDVNTNHSDLTCLLVPPQDTSRQSPQNNTSRQ